MTDKDKTLKRAAEAMGHSLDSVKRHYADKVETYRYLIEHEDDGRERVENELAVARMRAMAAREALQ